MTASQWERVESARRLLGDSSSARADPGGQVWRSILGDAALIDGATDPVAVVHWRLAQLAFIGEWLPREPLEAALGSNGRALGLSPKEIASCFDHVLEVVERVGRARPGGGD